MNINLAGHGYSGEGLEVSARIQPGATPAQIVKDAEAFAAYVRAQYAHQLAEAE